MNQTIDAHVLLGRNCKAHDWRVTHSNTAGVRSKCALCGMVHWALYPAPGMPDVSTVHKAIEPANTPIYGRESARSGRARQMTF